MIAAFPGGFFLNRAGVLRRAREITIGANPRKGGRIAPDWRLVHVSFALKRDCELRVAHSSRVLVLASRQNGLSRTEGRRTSWGNIDGLSSPLRRDSATSTRDECATRKTAAPGLNLLPLRAQRAHGFRHLWKCSARRARGFRRFWKCSAHRARELRAFWKRHAKRARDFQRF